ncbi:MAG: FAD-dependent oxidoreductase [Flavobacteriales bacterium]
MKSIWEERSFSGETALAVVGAGITGLFTALHYSRKHPDHRVVVLESGPHPVGASVKNAGFACFGSPSELLHDLDTLGETTALQRVEERWHGLLELRQELGDEAIGFEPVGGYEIFRTDNVLYTQVAERFDSLNAALRGILGKDVFVWADDRIAAMGLGAGHMTWNALEGAVDSGMLMRALLRKVQESGVEVRFNAKVGSWTEGQHAVALRLHDGTVLHAKQAVFATNGFSRGLAPDCAILPARGQVLLTNAIPGLTLKGTFHLDEGYFYFRHYQGRVLIGGGRHLDKAGETTEVDGTTPQIQQALEEVLRTLVLPGKDFSIAQRWSGVMGFREQGGPPLVERLSPRTVLAAGLGGIGVAVGIRVARQAVELVG